MADKGGPRQESGSRRSYQGQDRGARCSRHAYLLPMGEGPRGRSWQRGGRYSGRERRNAQVTALGIFETGYGMEGTGPLPIALMNYGYSGLIVSLLLFIWAGGDFVLRRKYPPVGCKSSRPFLPDGNKVGLFHNNENT